MTEVEPSRLHHVVFAVPRSRHRDTAAMFTDLGFTLQEIDLAALGLQVHLDWDGGVEIISPLAGSTEPVAAAVEQFLSRHGEGIYTVVIKVPTDPTAREVAHRYGATTRFEQHFDGEGTYLDETDLSVRGLPLTLLSTNVP